MDTIEAVNEVVLNELQPKFTELLGVWDYVGYSQPQRVERFQGATEKLRYSLDDFIAQENSVRLNMEQRIEEKRRELVGLCQQLRVPSYFPERGLAVCDLIQNLDNKAEELNALRRTRFDQYTVLRGMVLKLSGLLRETDDVCQKRLLNFPPIEDFNASEDGGVSATTRIPEQREIEQLSDLVNQMKLVYKPLAEQHISLMNDIARIAVDISYQPQSEREMLLLKSVGLTNLCANSCPVSTPGVVRKCSDTDDNGLSVPADQQDVPHAVIDKDEPVVDSEQIAWLTQWRTKLVKEKARLVGMCEELRAYLKDMWPRLGKSDEEQRLLLERYDGYKPEVLDALQFLCDEVDRCQQMKWEHLEDYLNSISGEAKRMAHACCISEEMLDLPKDLDESCDTEVLVNQLETLLERLNQTYKAHRPIYESIALYEELWQNLMEVELRLKDPAILSNRGGVLLKTEKEKKRLLKEVQRAEQEVLQHIEQYELTNKHSFSLSDGRTFKDFINDRWSSAKPSRDSSRARRSIGTANNIISLNNSHSRPNSGNFSGPPGAPI